ncbi:MAG TPA: hypothetical protein H9873_02720 [Candidatus Dorea gallistercoris]|uniref:Uncharacterized protein n=1 Tax=Candidatus Dorea gallistercoris TaxID=2838542 RepID=A0A9D1UE70_9FIRM|nr:hypothetical protein [Candidatus Dorea gallistercoris]
MKIKRRWKTRLINGGILTGVFIVAVIFFSYLTNNGNDSVTADMGAATYPQISFSYDGYLLNSVPGYVKEMDIPSIRDTITPVGTQGLSVNIQAYENAVSSLEYKVCTLGGEEILLEQTIQKPGEMETLDLSQEGLLAEERVLQIILYISEDKKVYYYTRIALDSGTNVSHCLDYIQDFHEGALNQGEGVSISSAIEPSDEEDNTTFAHVTIHSDYSHVTWGDLAPRVEGGERWSVKELRGTYTCAQLEYLVRCQGEENEDDLYKVTEYFRVRHDSERDHTYLLDYDRRMEQIFDPTRQVLSATGILLGIADYDVPYVVNEDGTIVSFIQAGELWNYNKNTDEISLVFSFSSAENTDERNDTSQHEIRLVEGDKEGNLTFAVYGYMNRGGHEGEVGVAIYYYDIETSSVEEKVFLSTDKSWGNAIEELGKLVYYNVDEDILYVLADQTFYEIDVKRDEQNVLAEGLADDQYVVSEDGHIVAYQSGGCIVVRNLSSGNERTVEGGEGETIRPLGFINNDFVYGVSREEDSGETISGMAVEPMYKVEIQNSRSEIIKTYEQADVYILGALFDGNMITLERATKSGNVYTTASEDYITNNTQKEESNITLEAYSTDLKETQMRLTYSDGISDKSPKLLKPKQVQAEAPTSIDFNGIDDTGKCYVYGQGRLQGVFGQAGDAVNKALECEGVVVSADQEYIWESGNRDLKYTIEGKDDEIESIRNQLAAGTAPMEIMEGLRDEGALDLTGCACQDLLYIINQDRPVIAMENARDGIILIGYQDSTVIYMDGTSGERRTASCEEIDEMTTGSGHTYVG